MYVVACSWRVVTIRMLGSSRSAATIPYTCIPGIPNTNSTPSRTSDFTRASPPVILAMDNLHSATSPHTSPCWPRIVQAAEAGAPPGRPLHYPLSLGGLIGVGKQNRSYDQANAASACHSERSEESRVPAYGRRCLAVSDLRFFTPLRFVQNDSAGVVFSSMASGPIVKYLPLSALDGRGLGLS